MLQRFIFFLCFLGLPFCSLMSSQYFKGNCEAEHIQQSARHIIRETVLTNCMVEIEEIAFKKYPIPKSGINDENRAAREVEILDKKREVSLYVRQSFFVDLLNKKIIECLQGDTPDFIGYETAFSGGKKALEDSGFFLDSNTTLCRNID